MISISIDYTSNAFNKILLLLYSINDAYNYHTRGECFKGIVSYYCLIFLCLYVVEIKIQMCTEFNFPWPLDSINSGLIFDFLTSLKCTYTGFSQILFVNISSEKGIMHLLIWQLNEALTLNKMSLKWHSYSIKIFKISYILQKQWQVLG